MSVQILLLSVSQFLGLWAKKETKTTEGTKKVSEKKKKKKKKKKRRAFF